MDTTPHRLLEEIYAAGTTMQANRTEAEIENASTLVVVLFGQALTCFPKQAPYRGCLVWFQVKRLGARFRPLPKTLKARP